MSAEIPPLNWLSAFQATAACGSVSVAADQLGLTQSAVSRQVKALEQFLGLALFARVKNRLQLTDRGLAYFEEVGPLLERLAETTRAANGSRRRANTLNLATLSTFGARWLVPRLGSFLKSNTDLNINLTVRSNLFDFAFDYLDGAFYFGTASWPGTVSTVLFGEAVAAVATPDIAQTLRTPADVAQAPLLEVASRPFAWREWFEHAGAPTNLCKPYLRVETFSMAIEAVSAGLCVGILPVFMIERELHAGTLQKVLDLTKESSSGYLFVVPETKLSWPSVKRFVDWLSYSRNGTDGTTF